VYHPGAYELVFFENTPFQLENRSHVDPVGVDIMSGQIGVVTDVGRMASAATGLALVVHPSCFLFSKISKRK
jgi:hypothetical protein